MASLRTVCLAAVLFAALVGGIMLMTCVPRTATQNINDSKHPKQDLSYKRIISIPDTEQRRARLGTAPDDRLVDMTAFVGMPEPYSAAVSKYVESALSAIEAAAISRRRYYHKDREGELRRYPDYANPIEDRDVAVPVVVLPRPEAIRNWTASSEARARGWRECDDALDDPGSVYGRTLIFEPGTRSTKPLAVPASPFETEIPSWDYYFESQFILDLGKLVVSPAYNLGAGGLKDQSAQLQVGQTHGARLVGEFVTVPVCLKSHRLRWAFVRNGSNVRRFLAYSLLDGNGPKREPDFQKSTSGPISPYVRPLICDRHQPRIKQHDELLLPSPLGWPPTYGEKVDLKLDDNPHEEWCFDDWFPSQKDACWVIREAEDSKPLQESFLLMPAREALDLPVFFIALFAETEPEQLLTELAALYKVSPDSALNSLETITRLNSLYEKVRDFPLTK